MNKTLLILITLGTFSISGCSFGPDSAKTSVKPAQKTTTGPTTTQPAGGRRSARSGPQDIKSLSTILERSNHPLTEAQVNYLLKLKTGPEFSQKMGEVLTDEQLSDLKNGSGRGGRRR